MVSIEFPALLHQQCLSVFFHTALLHFLQEFDLQALRCELFVLLVQPLFGFVETGDALTQLRLFACDVFQTNRRFLDIEELFGARVEVLVA